MPKRFAGLVIIAALSAPVLAQDDAKKVVEKAVAAHGGLEALQKFKASHAKIAGELSVAGNEMTFEGTVAFEYPGRYKVSFDASFMGQALKVVQVANGDKAKQSVLFGGMEVGTNGDDEKSDLRTAADLQAMTHVYPLLDGKKYEIKAEADGEVDGKKVAVVRATVLGSQKVVTLSFDKESGLLVKTQRKARGPGADGLPAEVDEETILGDFKKVSGVLTAMKTVVKHDGAKFMTYKLSDVVLSESLPKGTFATDD